jgi:hypothetical protein
MKNQDREGRAGGRVSRLGRGSWSGIAALPDTPEVHA